MEEYFTKKNLMIGSAVLVVVIIIIVVAVKMKSEKFILANSKVEASGVAVKKYEPNTYMISDKVGNLATTTDGSFRSINVTDLISLNAYHGKVGDVMVSNGDTAPPVWAPGVGLDDFTGKKGDEEDIRVLEDIGYQTFPGGLTIQWGLHDSINLDDSPLTFPRPFKLKCFALLVSVRPSDSAATNKAYGSIASVQANGIIVDKSTYKLVTFGVNGNYRSIVAGWPIQWLAIGF